MPKKARKLKFVVNCNPANNDVDKFHNFAKIGLMRQYIDKNSGWGMEIAVWDGDENLITMTPSTYWRNNRHPTLEELINPK